MKSPIVKRSIVIAGRRTSISLEDAFWEALWAIAESRGSSLSRLVATIERNRIGNLSSAIRLFILGHYQSRAEADLHQVSQHNGSVKADMASLAFDHNN